MRVTQQHIEFAERMERARLILHADTLEEQRDTMEKDLQDLQREHGHALRSSGDKTTRIQALENETTRLRKEIDELRRIGDDATARERSACKALENVCEAHDKTREQLERALARIQRLQQKRRG